MSRVRLVGVSEPVEERRYCMDCGRPLKWYQDLMCYDCCHHKLQAVLEFMSRDPDLIAEFRHGASEGIRNI